MEVNLIALAIPFFFVLIVLEWVVSRYQGVPVLRFHEAIHAISCGISSQVTGLLTGVINLLFYTAIWSQFALFEWSTGSVLTWVLGALIVDFRYYWWHRASHRINAMWAAHIVHHHSQDYNLAIALRQAWFTPITGLVFNIPMAMLGLPPLVWATCGALDTLYQFWIHTQTVGKLGPLEWVLNTPSHHRVHHGVNPRYIDKNYAGALIIWDRMFGTFAEEVEQPVYGTVAVFERYDPVWANLHYWSYMLNVARQTQRWQDALKVWVMPPEWAPEDHGGVKRIPEVDAETFQKWDHDRPPAPGLNGYVALHFMPLVIVLTGVLMVKDTVPWVTLGALGALVVWTVWLWGALYERRPWAIPMELARLVVLTAVTAALTWGAAWSPAAILTTALFALASSLWITRIPLQDTPVRSAHAAK